MDPENCDVAEQCSNRDKSCFKCFNNQFFRPHKEKVGLRAKSSSRKQTTKAGMQFEQDGMNAYNKAVFRGKDAARRQPNSGAMQGFLGDVITSEKLTAALTEFKERSSTTKSGEKSISIQKKWLDKLKEEAAEMNRDYYFLPFRYTGSDTDYVVMEYSMLMGYIETIAQLNEMVQSLQEENATLKQ